MSRYDRTHFFAFGVLPTLNSLAMLVYGLGLATHGTGGAGRSIPALLVLVAINGLMALTAAIKRGRDLGWSAWITVLSFWLALALGPVLLVLVGYLVFANPKSSGEAFGPPAAPATVVTWYWAIMNLIWPWFLLAFLGKLL